MNRLACLVASLALFSGGAVSAEAEPETGTLIVNVSSLRSDEGDLRFVLFDSKKSFLITPLRADIVEVRSPEVQAREVRARG